MAAPTPELNITVFDSHDRRLLVIGDSSYYPTGWNIVTPTLAITVPGYPEKQIEFDAQNINIFNSNALGITCDVDNCDLENLPDGIYKIKYAIYPSYKYNVTKTFLRVDSLYAKFDEVFLNLELFECDGQIKRNQRMQLDEIEFYIQGAIAAGNRCATKLAKELYDKAANLLNKLTKSCK